MRKTVLLASAAMSAVFAAAPALAQDAVPAPSDEQAVAVPADEAVSSDIVVTARRRAEDSSKVPIAITAFSGEQLVAKGVTNVYSLTKVTPGLNITAGGGKANPFIVLRGQSKAVTGNGSPGVITYLNDVPLPSYGSAIQTYDMQNVQVLKGPQGTLFGRNSIGGAVLTVTNAPTHEFGGYVSAEIASHDTYMGEAAINVPILKDVVSLRLATQIGHEGSDIKTYNYTGYTLTQQEDDSFVATPGRLNPAAHDVDEYALESYRASLLIEPTPWFKNVTVGDYSKVRGQNNQTFAAAYPNGYEGNDPALYYIPANLLGLGNYSDVVAALAQCPANTIDCNVFAAINAAQGSIAGRYNFSTLDPWIARTIVKGITNTTTIKLGDNHQLKNILAIRTTDSFSNTTLTGLPIPIINTGNQVRLKQTTEEIQLAGSFFGDTLKYTVGGFFYNEKPNGLGGFQALEVNSFFGISHTQAVTYLHNSSQAVYGQIDYSLDRFIPGLTLTAGLRQTWDAQGACTVSINYDALAPGGGMVLTSPESDSAIPSEEACRSGSSSNLTGPISSFESEQFADAKFKKLTYTLGANWQITPDAMIYVAHRRGYRAGGYNTPTTDPYLAAYQTFRPETLTDYEVGAKLRFRSGDMRGSLDIAAFTGRDTDIQIPITTSQLSGGAAPCVPDALGTDGHETSNCDVDGTPGSTVPIEATTTTVNGGSIRIRGFEAAATFSPFRGLTFGGSLAYVDVDASGLDISGRIGNVVPVSRIPTAETFAIQGQSQWSSNANVTVEYPDEVLGGTLSASADYHYNGSYQTVELTVPSWHQIDLRVALDNIADTGLSLSAYVRNLTNETTYVGTGASSPSGIGMESYVLGKSRTVGLLASYKFGAR